MKEQGMVRIPIHSVVDLITNSSTEIFVNSEGSLVPCKELINEILKLLGTDKKCDDAFDVRVEMNRSNIDDCISYSEDDQIDDQIGIKKKDSWEVEEQKRTQFINNVLSGQIEKPEWWDDILDGNVEWLLVIESREPQYDKLAALIHDFLYSGEYYEHCND